MAIGSADADVSRRKLALPQDGGTAVVDAIVAAQAGVAAPLMPVLHAVQEALGYIPREVIPQIAHGLNLTRAEVYGVVTFYHHFRTEPTGRHIVAICQAEACQAMGSDALTAHAKRSLGVDYHEITGDGLFSLEPVYCLGNCACTPSVMVDGDVHARVTPQRFDEIVAELREAAAR
jgi:formate dehydrogenase subunit gamma